MPRGGKRNGKPGVAYPQRSDLNAQPVRTAPGQTYGKATAQAAAQAAMPLAATPPLPQAGAAPASDPAPVPLGGLYEPTMRQDEPIQAGLQSGPAGPSTRDLLLAVYRQYPTMELLEMIERMR